MKKLRLLRAGTEGKDSDKCGLSKLCSGDYKRFNRTGGGHLNSAGAQTDMEPESQASEIVPSI